MKILANDVLARLGPKTGSKEALAKRLLTLFGTAEAVQGPCASKSPSCSSALFPAWSLALGEAPGVSSRVGGCAFHELFSTQPVRV